MFAIVVKYFVGKQTPNDRHAEGEAVGSAVRHRWQADEVDHFVDACGGDAVGGGQGAEVVAGRASGVDRAGLQHRADFVQGCGVVGVGAAVDGGAAFGGDVQADQHAHGGGLPGAVRAEEAGHGSGADGEGQVVDGFGGAVALRQ